MWGGDRPAGLAEAGSVGPSGLAEDTRVATPQGTFRLGDFRAGRGAAVLDHSGRPVFAGQIIKWGEQQTVRLRTSEGFELAGTPDHPLLTVTLEDGIPTMTWRALRDFRAGDRVVISRRGPAEDVASGRDLRMGVLLGAWLAEGNVGQRRAQFTNQDKQYFDTVRDALHELVTDHFDAWERPEGGDKRYDLDIRSRAGLAALRDSPLWEMTGWRSVDKRVPEYIWESGNSVKRAFLQSLFHGDGSSSASKGRIQVGYATKSPQLARDVQQLLLEFGIVARLYHRPLSTEHRVYISNRHDAELFAGRIGFYTWKQQKLENELDELAALPSRGLTEDNVPYVAEYFRDLVRSKNIGPELGWKARKSLGEQNLDRFESFEARRPEIRGLRGGRELLAVLDPLFYRGYYYAHVDDVTQGSRVPVSTLTVDSEDHAFVAGGFVSHNSGLQVAAKAPGPGPGPWMGGRLDLGPLNESLGDRGWRPKPPSREEERRIPPRDQGDLPSPGSRR